MTTHLTDKNGAPASTRKDGGKMAGPARPAPAKKEGAFSRVSRYLQEVQAELKKTTWPDRPKLIASTKVVLAAVTLVGFYLWIVDMILTYVFGWIVRGAGR